jgi:hypothetical protein
VLLREIDHMDARRKCGVRHGQHFNVASIFQIGVSRGLRTESSGMLASCC